jgi:hypothetical protein
MVRWRRYFTIDPSWFPYMAGRFHRPRSKTSTMGGSATVRGLRCGPRRCPGEAVSRAGLKSPILALLDDSGGDRSAEEGRGEAVDAPDPKLLKFAV